MKSQRLIAWLIPALLPLCGYSQTDENEIIELSPFVVTADEQSGYYASQTLAGSRLKTDVADVASSIQILTAEFIEDVGANNLNDLFLFTTNTEAAGLGGNFSDYRTGATSLDDEAFRINPQGAQRVRGLSPADITRNYFLSPIKNDSYNTERVEINRGANAILFGLGSPAGISNTSLNQARFSDFGKVKATFDSEGSRRFEFDFNDEIVKDRLAVRIGVLQDDTDFRQEPAFEDDHRVYANALIRPWKGASIRAFMEKGDINANRPNLVFPASTLDFWFDSNPVVRSEIQSILDANGILDVAGNPLTVPANTVIAFDPSLYDIYTRNVNNILKATDVNRDGTVDAADDLARIHALRNVIVFPQASDQRYVQHPNASRQMLRVFEWDAVDPSGVNTIQSNLNSAQWLPKLRGGVPSIADPSGNGNFSYNYNATVQPWRDRNPVLTPSNFSDLNIFDYTENLLAGNSAFQNENWTHQNIAIEQLFLNNALGFELVVDKQQFERETFVPFQGYTGVFIDLMTSYLGSPNPNFGRPFVQARTNKREIRDDRKTVRLTGFYRLNPEEWLPDSRIASWFGTQTFTGLFNTYEQSGWRRGYNQYITDTYAGSTLRANDNQINDQNRTLNYIVYLSDQNLAELGSVSEVRLNRMADQVIWNPGQTLTFQDIDPQTGEFFTNSVQTDAFLDSYGEDYQDIDSVAAVWNGTFFERSLIGLVGWRKDEALSATYDAGLDENALADTENMILINGGETVSVETLSWSLVGHVPERFLPAGTGVSLHYGYSENFTVGASARDLYGNRVLPPSGETKEYGFTARLMQDKLYVRLNWFETTLLNRALQGSGNLYDTFINRILLHSYGHLGEAMVVGFIPPSTDPETGNVDPGTPNYATGQEAFNFLSNLIPASIIEEANLVGMDGTGNVATNRRNISFGDTEDVSAKGFEIELTWNPKPNWRLTLNAAKQETQTDNYSPRLAELLEVTDPYFSITSGSVRNLAFYPNYDTAPLTYMTGEPSLNNSIADRTEELVMAEYRNALAQQGKVSNEQRKWRVNLVTNYTFRDGFLENVSIGGAYRWQDGAVIGYPTELIDGMFISDISHPHIAPSESNVDAWLRYSRKLFNKRLNWTIELRVQNINGDAHDLVPVAAQTSQEYAVAAWRSGPPRIWRITNTISF